MQKKKKLKINTASKQYQIKDSAFYNITTKKKLAQVLLCDIPTLKLLASDTNYNCFIDNSGIKPREIQTPLLKLDKIHTRVASLLCRIQNPEYLHSGVKGRSHITNALSHSSTTYSTLTSDIKSFYPSTTRRIIFSFFNKRMKCSPDVSDLLSHLCTYNGALPTGSRLSMPVAFWANKSMFDTLNRLSKSLSINFTLFVDDITFTGENVNHQFLNKVEMIINNSGHTMHPKKTKLYAPSDLKIITGVGIKDGELRVLNKHHRSIHQDFVQWKILQSKSLHAPSLSNRLLGKLCSQGSVDPRFKDKARSLRKAVSKAQPSFTEIHT